MSDENEKSPELKEIKIILLGENGVGKTSIINRYINNEFRPETENVTLGSNCFQKDIKKNKDIYRMRIWDTTGQEKFHCVTQLFIKGSNIVLLVYSVDSIESFQKLTYWYDSMKDFLEEGKYILCIVANKNDLEEESVVTEEEGKKYAEEKNAIFKSVSAKEGGDCINNLFDKLIDELIKIDYVSITKSYRLQKKHVKGKKKDKHRSTC